MNVAAIMAHQPMPEATPRERRIFQKTTIIAEVAAKHGLSITELKSRDRAWRISHPRQEAMYELSKRTRMSLPAIARSLGLTDHTTVIHGIRAHEARIAAEAEKATA